MNTNEAPEKIYMTPSFGEPNNVLLASFSKSHLDFHRDVEYTLTDAFIEKACEWLMENVEKHISADGEYTVYYREMSEGFKKYMKGE